MKCTTRIARTMFGERAPGLSPLRTVIVLIFSLLIHPALAGQFELTAPRSGVPVRNADGSEMFQLLPGECSDVEYFSDELQKVTSDCGRARNRIEYYETSTSVAGDRT